MFTMTGAHISTHEPETHVRTYKSTAQHAHMHTIFMRGCDLDVFNFGNLEGLVPSSLV